MQSTRARSAHRALGIAITVALLLGLGGRGVAQTCTGDCSGSGRVTIRDLILAVNIALGRADAAQCPALGGGPVGIPQLIASVGNALCACAPCPTRPPTATYTSTALPTPTRTATFTPTPLTSTWREDNIKIPSSSCPQGVTKDLRSQLASVEGSYIVRVADGVVELEDGDGNTAAGLVDPDGTIHVEVGGTQNQGGCVVTVVLPLAVNLTQSPTTATYAARVTTRGCATNLNCGLRITSRWTRTSAAAARSSARSGTSLRAALHLTP
ncbi:MAG: hypothetical protein ACRERC_25300 [Candidatus Binatia bacterium]